MESIDKRHLFLMRNFIIFKWLSKLALSVFLTPLIDFCFVRKKSLKNLLLLSIVIQFVKCMWVSDNNKDTEIL